MPPQRRAPSADAQAGVVQAAEGWATTGDDTVAWSDVTTANGTEVAQYNNQPVGTCGYVTNNILIWSGTWERMRDEGGGEGDAILLLLIL